MRLRNLGITPEDIAAANAQADAIAKIYPNITKAESLGTFAETRYAMGDTQHAIEAMKTMSDFITAMSATHTTEQVNAMKDQIYSAVKASEQAGQIKPEDLSKFLNFETKAAMVSGGIVDPAKILAAYKYSRNAQFGWDDQFRYGIMPELVQEFSSGGRGGGGSRGGAGPMLSNFKRLFVDQASQFTEQAVKDGLIDPSKVKGVDRKGHLNLMPDAVIGGDEAALNPYQYIKDRVMPALRKAGIDPDDTSPEGKAKVARRVSQWGGTQLEQQLVTAMVTQAKQIDARLQQLGVAAGTNKTNDNLNDNYNQAIRNAKGALDQARADAFGSSLGSATNAVNQFTGAMQEISSYFKGEQSGIKTLADLVKRANDATKIEPPKFPTAPELFKPNGIIPKWWSGNAPPGFTNWDDWKHKQHSFPREEKPRNLGEVVWGQHLPTGLGGHGTGAEPMPTDNPSTRTARIPNMPGVSVPSNPAQNAVKISPQISPTISASTMASSLTADVQKAAQAAVQNISANGVANVTLSVGSVNTGSLQSEVQSRAQAAVHDVTVHANVNVETSTSGGGGDGNAKAGPPKLSKGGHIMREGLAYLHRGEEVVPAERVAALRGAGNGGGGQHFHAGGVTINIHGGNNNPEKIAEIVHDRMMRTAEAKLSDMGFMTS